MTLYNLELAGTDREYMQLSAAGLSRSVYYIRTWCTALHTIDFFW